MKYCFLSSCCNVHDKCYEKTQAVGACTKLEKYLTPYEWRCNLNEISIGGYKLKWNSMKKTLTRNNNSATGVDYETGYPECTENGSVCGAALCECDKQAVLCFARYPYPTSKPKCI